jgi:uncharacterized protein YijF (DUF1287 family)
MAGRRWLVAGWGLACALACSLVLAAPVVAPVVVASARAQVGVTTAYDPAYVKLGYPGGDVPRERGVCSDVVIRAFRGAGIDLQRLVHEDMRNHFRAYPALWGLRGPDRNIDHRRVPNLRRYFERRGMALPVTGRNADYRPGDVVSWVLPNGLAHVGIVSDRRAVLGNGRRLVVHNIGQGAREEDVLFAWRQDGHYRWNDAAAGQVRADE